MALDQQVRQITLHIIGRLVQRLHEEGILYCHWKSNHTLSASLRGVIDIDLLVDPAAAPAVTGLLAGVGFKPVVQAPCFAYPAISHFLALDRQTGSLAHLHLYYRMITGEGHLKGYHLPWEHLVLSSRQFDAARGIYVVDPNVEMILFMVRAALKLRPTAWLQGATARPCFRRDSLAEFRWLSAQVAVGRLGQLGRDLLGHNAAQRMLNLLDRRRSIRQLLAFRSSVVAVLHPHRRYGPLEGAWHRWLKDVCWISTVMSRRYLRRAFPATRFSATGGRLIAFIGPDGSGKSTVVRETTAWLSQHLDALSVYFGSGDGPASIPRWPLQVAARMARGIAPTRSQGHPPSLNGTRGVRVKSGRSWELIARVLWALTLSYEKRVKLRRAWRAHERGLIVICDRFPQNHVMGYMDGPLLSHWHEHRSKLLRALARWERAPYEWAEAHPPDLVIRLDVAPQIAARRKADMGLAEIEKRDAASRMFQYPPQTRVVPVDTGTSLDDLLPKVKGIVWDAL